MKYSSNHNKRQCIVITGASSGLGAALTKQYAMPNYTLGLVGRNKEKLQTVAAYCHKQGAETHILSCDISTEFKKLKRWLNRINTQHSIDTIIANAGITANSSIDGQLESWEKTQSVIQTNTLGVMATLHPVVQYMQNKQSGHIVIISSLAAFYGMPITPSYCASKSAIKAYGEALRGLLKNDNIKVSIVYPGFIKTDMSDAFPGSKPLMINVEKAAKAINKGILKKKNTISFPFPLNIGMKILPLLPTKFIDLVLKIF